MDLATSSAVVPLGTSLVLPSGSLIWILSDIFGSTHVFRWIVSVYGRGKERVKQLEATKRL
jgi:hypothetical protein